MKGLTISWWLFLSFEITSLSMHQQHVWSHSQRLRWSRQSQLRCGGWRPSLLICQPPSDWKACISSMQVEQKLWGCQRSFRAFSHLQRTEFVPHNGWNHWQWAPTWSTWVRPGMECTSCRNSVATSVHMFIVTDSQVTGQRPTAEHQNSKENII